MLVSVLMSVYKEDSRYIRESIESVLNQTFTDFEFIIVGDTPETDRDRVFRIIQEYAEKDKRIIFVPNKLNIGLTKSLNIGLRYCKGRYIARMDADDICVPERLEKQVIFMESNPQILASSAWLQLIDKNGKFIDGKVVKYNANSKELRLGLLSNSVLAHPVSIFRRIINNEMVRYDGSVAYAQDYSLWVWILQHGYGDLSNIQEVLLYYRITEGQITFAHRNAQLECAKKAQIKAFILNRLPVVESFLKLFSTITIDCSKNLRESEAKSSFKDYFKIIPITKKNYSAIKYLAFTYVSYFFPSSQKKVYRLLFDVSRCNPKLLLYIESEYFFDSMKRILRNK